MTIADKLSLLANTKENIKQALENRGAEVGSAPFSQYPTIIDELPSGGGGDEPIGKIALNKLDDTLPGWLPCDGSMLSMAGYPELGEALGEAHTISQPEYISTDTSLTWSHMPKYLCEKPYNGKYYGHNHGASANSYRWCIFDPDTNTNIVGTSSANSSIRYVEIYEEGGCFIIGNNPIEARSLIDGSLMNWPSELPVPYSTNKPISISESFLVVGAAANSYDLYSRDGGSFEFIRNYPSPTLLTTPFEDDYYCYLPIYHSSPILESVLYILDKSSLDVVHQISVSEFNVFNTGGYASYTPHDEKFIYLSGLMIEKHSWIVTYYDHSLYHSNLVRGQTDDFLFVQEGTVLRAYDKDSWKYFELETNGAGNNILIPSKGIYTNNANNADIYSLPAKTPEGYFYLPSLPKETYGNVTVQPKIKAEEA